MLRTLSHLRWLVGLEQDLLSAAWRGRHSRTTRAALYRFSHQLWPYTAANTLPVKSLEELFPGIRCHLQLHAAPYDPKYRYYRSYTHHVCVLASLCSHLRPRRIFEFGTYLGEMTVNFWLNGAQDCEVFTLDLPPGQEATRLLLSQGDLEMVRRRRLGEQFEGLSTNGRIRQLCCDSAEFDSGPYASSFDFIYVDGAHTYDYVANDSRHAFRMLRPGGVIVWDDYNWYWKGLVKYLQEEARHRPIFQIEGTEMALYKNDGGAA